MNGRETTSADGPAVTILLDDDARRALQAHAHRRRDREVAGFLVGRRPERQPDGRYVVVVAGYIEARFTTSRGGSVALTPDSWHFAHVELARRYPGHPARLVGWAHTHPGFGVFLSEPDLFIHRTFFRRPWQIVAVVDPIARTGGFFVWDAALRDVHRSPFAWHWE